MFVEKLKENNQHLLKAAFDLHRKKEILPDTYVLDLDAIYENALSMVEKAKPLGVELYFMLKQIGRNPLVARKLIDAGFKGCVAVDFNEALTMIENNIHISNVGHLVQIPEAALEKILSNKPDYCTVYSIEKIDEINEACKKLGLKQKLLIRITDEDAEMYSGQIAGFRSSNLPEILKHIEGLGNVEFGGITVFPALLFDSKENAIKETVNVNGAERAKIVLDGLGYKDYMVNLPSASCTASIELVKKIGGNICSCEPGHGLTGTTPLHKVSNQPEKVAYCYVSEVSHNFLDKAYCYGGGHYRRGHMENCLVGSKYEDLKMVKVAAPDMDSIDYHYELDGNQNVGDTCIMAYRTQIFTTRSQVAVVAGILKNMPNLIGLYDALGKEIKKNW